MGAYAWQVGMIWAGGLSGGANSVFWSGEGNVVKAAQFGTTLEKTPIGSILSASGENVPYSV